MSNTTTWEPRQYLVRVTYPLEREPRLAVAGYVSPDGLWGIHKQTRGHPPGLPFQLTHLASGFALAPGFEDVERAEDFAAQIAPLIPWHTVRGAHDVPLDVRAAVREIYTTITGYSWLTGRPLSLRSRQVRQRRERTTQEVAAR